MFLKTVLNRLFGATCVVLIKGKWKSGKTDFALWIAEKLLEWNIVSKVASNIESSDQRVTYISSLERLREWLHEDLLDKLYILDEGLTGLPSRKSMSRENVTALQILPEISKGRARIIVVVQTEENFDSGWLHPIFLRGTFVKKGDEVLTSLRKQAILYSDLFRHKPITLRNIPQTSIQFDPYKLAPLTLLESEDVELDFGGKIQKSIDLAKAFGQCGNFSVVAKDIGKKPMTVKREVMKYIKWSMREIERLNKMEKIKL